MEELDTISQEPTIEDITEFLLAYSIGEPDKAPDLASQIHAGLTNIKVTVGGGTAFAETISLSEAIRLEKEGNPLSIHVWDIIPGDTIQEAHNPLP